MQRPAKPLTSVRFRAQPPGHITKQASFARVAEFGRRKGLKIPRWQHRAGSSPAPGTIPFQYYASSYNIGYLHGRNGK